MDARAWRVAAGAAAALLGILALVAWRGDALAGGWLWALRTTALLAVAGLLTSVLVAGRHGTAPAPRREVVVRVPPTGAPHAQVRAATADGGRRLRRVLLLAVLSTAPVLVVLALAPAAPRPADLAGRPLPGTATPSSATDPATPSPAASARSGAPSATSDGPTAPPSAAAAPPGAGPPEGGPPATGPPAAGPPVVESAAAPAPGSCEHTVLQGDTLWGIAAEQLGPGATVQQVGDRWRALYARNAAGVGADPDLIRPGLVLSSCD